MVWNGIGKIGRRFFREVANRLVGDGPRDLPSKQELLRRGGELDDGLFEFAGEFEGHLFRVVLAHRCAGVFGAVERLVEREAERQRALDATLGHLLAVHLDRGLAALAQAAVVLEVVDDGVRARGERFGPGDGVAGDAREIVAEGRLALEQVETPPSFQNMSCISLSLAGSLAARLVASEKSSLTL